MNWLITGGCGFLGTALVQRLVAEGHNVRVLDNFAVGSRDDLRRVCEFDELNDLDIVNSKWSINVQLIEGDILDPGLAMRAASGIDVIVHLAANTGVAPSVENPRMDCVTNVIGTFNYLEAARLCGVPRFVFASSGAPIGEAQPPIHEEMAPHPVSPYGASKLAGEGYCSAYFRTFGIETIALRFGNVYGPGSVHKNSVVARFVQQALIGEPLTIFGDGYQTRDFIYIDDLIEALVLSATRPNVGGQIFQIATNTETTVAEMLSVLMEVLDEHDVPRPDVSFASGRAGDVHRNFSDITKAKAKLAWRPSTGLEKGLRKTVEYFLAGVGGCKR
jgi:UDP-glucose 4-epimerase